jgi:hypothetical protein
MGVEAAARTHIPATQDSSTAVANSRRCNPQSDPKSYFGQVQTHKVTPDALALFTFQQDTITNEREKYPLQDQTTTVAPEALAIFSDRPVTMWTYARQRGLKEHNKEATPEAMSNYLSITIHLRLSAKIQSQVPVRSQLISLNEGSHNLNRRHRPVSDQLA